MKTLFLFSFIVHTLSQQFNNTLSYDKQLLKLNKTTHEKEAIKLLNDLIYQDYKFSNFEFLREMYYRNWLQASQIILDYLLDSTTPDISTEINTNLKYLNDTSKDLRTWLKTKKKNILRISPVFEWSQDNEYVKIRLKFAKNLESPGEKDILKFQVNCTRTHLLVQGYKTREDYITYYYRNMDLYDHIVPYTCKAYKETDGTYIIKFKKGQNTLYWNFLDQITGDHFNTYTWFEVFTPFDNKAKYTQFRDWAMDNLLESDLSYHVQEKMEEKRIRMKKIERIYNFFKKEGGEMKNYCLSPMNEKYCYLPNYYDWGYWISK
jgi:hypothetical protein